MNTLKEKELKTYVIKNPKARSIYPYEHLSQHRFNNRSSDNGDIMIEFVHLSDW